MPEKRKIDVLIDTMFHCFPSDNRKEIAKKMSARLHRKIPVSQIEWALTILRANSEHYGWSVAQCKYGSPAKGETGRFVRYLIDSDGERYFEDGDQSIVHLFNGLHSIASHGSTMNQNASAVMDMAVAYIQSPTLRRRMRQLSGLLSYAADQQADILKQVNIDRPSRHAA